MPMPMERMSKDEVYKSLEEMKKQIPGTHWEDIKIGQLQEDSFFFNKRYHGLRMNKERVRFWRWIRN